MKCIFAIGLQKRSENSTFILYDDVAFIRCGYEPEVEGDRERAISEVMNDVKMWVGDNSKGQLINWRFIDGDRLFPSFEIKLTL